MHSRSRCIMVQVELWTRGSCSICQWIVVGMVLNVLVRCAITRSRLFLTSNITTTTKGFRFGVFEEKQKYFHKRERENKKGEANVNVV